MSMILEGYSESKNPRAARRFERLRRAGAVASLALCMASPVVAVGTQNPGRCIDTTMETVQYELGLEQDISTA
jgi:hypothetical protein